MTGDFSDIPAAPAQTNIIPVWDTVKAGCMTVFENVQLFLNAAWVWILILSGTSLLGSLLTMWTFNPIFLIVLSIGAGLICISAFLVTWHRHVLLNETPPGPAQIRVGHREWRFLLFSLAPVGIMIAGSIVISFAGLIGFPPVLVGVLGLVLAVVIVVVSVRISLFAPLASLDVPGNLLERSWNLTRGNGFQIFGGLFLIGLAFAIVGFILRSLLGGMMHGIGIILAIPMMVVLVGVYVAEAACIAGFLCHGVATILGWKLPLQRPGPTV